MFKVLEPGVIENKQTAITPLIIGQWEEKLGGYVEYEKIIEGIRSGFKLGLKEESILKSAKGSQGNKELSYCMKKEMDLNRIIGPFIKPPIPDLHISPVQAISKKTPGKCRLIHNLSAPHGNSVNEAIPDEIKSVTFCKIADVVDLLLQHQHAQMFMSKVDLKDAFRIVPIHKSNWRYLGMKINEFYYVDTVLPMGCGTSCAIFQTLTRALCWMVTKEIPGISIFGYLDDFLLVSQGRDNAEKHLAAFLKLCHNLGIPIAEEKTAGPLQSLIFLGIGIDTINNSLYLDIAKKDKYIKKITEFMGKRKGSVKQWQSLVGVLAFLAQVVQPGKAFMSRISRKLGCRSKRIRVSNDVKSDLMAWKFFINNDMFKPFRMLDSNITPSAHWWTDASGAHGFGAVFGSKWLYGSWNDTWWSNQNIMLLELYPIWLSIKVWGHLVKDSCVLIHTDNQALVSVVTKRSSKLAMANALLRDISVDCMRFNIILQCTHVAGIDNSIADMLSRLQIERFTNTVGRDMDLTPTACPRKWSPSNCKNMLMSFCDIV